MKARAKAFQILRLEKNGDEMILLFHFMSKGSWNKNRSEFRRPDKEDLLDISGAPSYRRNCLNLFWLHWAI